MAVLHAGLFDIWKKAGCSWLPAILFSGHNAGRMVLSEYPVSQGWIAQGIADLLKPLMCFSRPVCAAVLEHKLIDSELPVLASQQPDS